MTDNRRRDQDAEREPALPPDLALLLSAMRQEFDAKVSGLKAWGVAMTFGGGAVGGFVAEMVKPGVINNVAGYLLPFV